MSDLRKEIKKIFNEIDENLQNNKESSMTIYDCFDFYYKDKNKFLNAIHGLIDNCVILKKDDRFEHNLMCDRYAYIIISCSPTLAQIIIESLRDKKFISFKNCKKVCDFIDVKYQEYRKANPLRPLEEIVKDYPYLEEIIKSFNKNKMCL